MQLDLILWVSENLVPLIGLIVTLIVTPFLILWYWNNIRCRLTIDFEEGRCTHSLTDSLGIWFEGYQSKINATGFRVKFIVHNKSKKGTTIYKIRHEVRHEGIWRVTEERELQEPAKLHGDDIASLDRFMTLGNVLLDENELQCRVILYHTHGRLKKKYVSGLTV